MHFVDLRGARMPALGFGTWQLTGAECVRAVRQALEIGYRHIDTAQIYENEAEVGRAIADSHVSRAEIFLTTKVWTSNYTAERVANSVEESLRKLRTPYVDLLLMHWPNPDVPLAETLTALQTLLERGKARAIGVSNFPVPLMREAVEQLHAPIACNQVEYHVLLSQRPVLGYARAHGMAVTAYSPLGRGKLASHPALLEIGRKHGKTAGQVALRWLIEQDGVAAIPKAASEKNARLNFEIFDFELDDAGRRTIDGLNNDTRLVDPDFAPTWDAA